MRKILSFAALALSSGAAVISAGGAAHASSGAHDWCAAPVHALKVDAACITNHSTIHVGLHDVDLDSNWCLGAFSAFGDVFASPALSCEDKGAAHHVPGPPPMGDHDCDDVCKPHTPPPPPPVPCPPPHPCPPPPPPPVPCPPPVMTPPPCPPPVPCPPPPCPPVPCPPPVPMPCPPGDDDHHWTGTPAAGHADHMAGLPILGTGLGGLL